MRIKIMLYALYLLILSAGESYLLMVMSFILLIISILLDVNQYLNEREMILNVRSLNRKFPL